MVGVIRIHKVSYVATFYEVSFFSCKNYFHSFGGRDFESYTDLQKALKEKFDVDIPNEDSLKKYRINTGDWLYEFIKVDVKDITPYFSNPNGYNPSASFHHLGTVDEFCTMSADEWLERFIAEETERNERTDRLLNAN